MLGLVLCGGLGGCRQDRDALPTVLRRGLSGEPATLDPTAAGDTFSNQVLIDLFEGLTAESPSGQPVPAVAAAWEVDQSGTQYTFHLRNDALWSNGEPVLARHFVQAWQRVVDPRTGSSGADDLGLITGARAILSHQAAPEELAAHAVDDRTLVVKLERPAPFFPGLLSHPSTFPIYSTRRSSSRDPTNWISNGAYVLKAWQPGTRINLAINKLYWNASQVQIAEVEYQFSSDENAQYARYRAGQLDMTDAVPSSALGAIKKSMANELLVAPYLGTAYYGINLTSEALLKSPDLRKALSMAIDRKRLVELLGFGQAPAYGFVPPGVWNYKPQSVSWATLEDDARIIESKRLYALAGYSRDNPLHVRVLFNNNPAIKQTAVLISSMWNEILGVDSKFDEEEYRVFLETRHDRRRFDIARLAWVADFNDAGNFLDILRRNSANNDEAYSSTDFEALLERSASTADIKERRKTLESAERVMLNDYPIIPLYHYVSKRLVKPYIRVVSPSPLDRFASKDMSFVAAH